MGNGGGPFVGAQREHWLMIGFNCCKALIPGMISEGQKLLGQLLKFETLQVKTCTLVGPGNQLEASGSVQNW